MTDRGVPAGRRAAGRRRMTFGARLASVALLVAVTVAGGACGSDDESDTFRAGPAFHSAGPEARLELQEVLQSQAELIAVGNWKDYFELYVPTERARCSAAVFGIFAEQIWMPLRDQAGGKSLAARVLDVKVNGFRAAVDYQMVVRGSDIATQQSTDSYLKLGSRWFIEEPAC